MRDAYYFISDIHLGLQAKADEKIKEEKLVRLLKTISEDAKELYILGDLFDYWFEYKRVYQKGFYKTLSALSDLAAQGVKITYLIGNHDFLHRDFFREDIGARLCRDAIVSEIEGLKFYLAHGDGLVKNDIGYLILKKVLRSRFAQWLYSIIHPDLGIAIASLASRKSRNYTAKKDYGETDGMYEAAKGKIDDGYDYVIFGHSHRREFREYKTGRYINLGTWRKTVYISVGICAGRI